MPAPEEFRARVRDGLPPAIAELTKRLQKSKRHREEKIAKSASKKRKEEETKILDRRENGRGKSYLILKGTARNWSAASKLTGEKWKERIEAFEDSLKSEESFGEESEPATRTRHLLDLNKTFYEEENESSEEKEFEEEEEEEEEQLENYLPLQHDDGTEDEEVDISN